MRGSGSIIADLVSNKKLQAKAVIMKGTLPASGKSTKSFRSGDVKLKIIRDYRVVSARPFQIDR